MPVSQQTINYDAIRSLVQDTLIPKVVDNIFESSSLLSMLMQSDRVLSAAGRMSSGVSGGQNIIQPLRYAKSTAVGTGTGHDVLDITPPESGTAAVYDFTTFYYATINIAKTDELAVSGDRAIVNFLAQEVQLAEDSLKDKIANDLYTGTDAIVGLNTAIGTGTYGNIDGSTYTFWQSGVDNTAHTGANMELSTSSSYLLKLLAAGWKSCQHLNKPPNFIFCGQNIFDIAERIANASAQFTTPTSARAKRMADLGFSVLEYRGIPLVVDNYLDDNSVDSMYMGNDEYLTLYYHPDNNFKMSDWVEPANQLSKIAKITATLQLAISNRRFFYRWSNLNN